MQFSIETMRDGYAQVCQTVIGSGTKVAPRGIPTREILGATIVLHNPTDALPIGINRKLNVSFAAVEAAQLCAGVSDYDLTIRINPNMRQFANERKWGEPYFHGAYGPRIKRPLQLAVDRITKDSDTRQAVVDIWHWNHDLIDTGLSDVPCTLSLHFMVRLNRLNLHTTMRSNDVWWGLAYDAFQFTQLQLSVANVLGIEPGTYYHTTNSLHAYERDFDAIKELSDAAGKRPSNYPLGFSGSKIGEMQRRAKSIIGNEVLEDATDSERWYRKRLHGTS